MVAKRGPPSVSGGAPSGRKGAAKVRMALLRAKFAWSLCRLCQTSSAIAAAAMTTTAVVTQITVLRFPLAQ
jgi:hypothetical protein